MGPSFVIPGAIFYPFLFSLLTDSRWTCPVGPGALKRVRGNTGVPRMCEYMGVREGALSQLAWNGPDQQCWLMAEHLAGPALGELGEVSTEGKPGSWSLVPEETKMFASWPACAIRGFPGNCKVLASRRGF